jgi:hypothetical protein
LLFKWVNLCRYDVADWSTEALVGGAYTYPTVGLSTS